jgi:ketosteroid isomerase-like protein
MKNDNVAAVRNAYAVAERKDLEGWISLFTPDGVFVDNSVGATYRGHALAEPVRNYGTAFSNMHRELYRIYVDGNVVVVLASGGNFEARTNTNATAQATGSSNAR